MHFSDLTPLLDPARLPYTSGIERLPDGVLHVAVLTRMPGVTPAMFEWWFARYLQTTEHYRRWHPRDHLWMDWEDKSPESHIGAKHLVHELIGGKLQKLRIAFEAPEEFFGDALAAHPEAVAVCARPGLLGHPIELGRLVHLALPTSWGCELHSRFWLGMVHGTGRMGSVVDRIANRSWLRKIAASDQAGRALQVHCHEEMTTLAGFLPELFAAETGPSGV
ncbi:MAG: hypothetical protein AAF430_17935 [Myxococcota bacterium]